MPKVTRPTDHPQAIVELPDGTVVARGKSADVDDDTAVSLGEQGWTVAADQTSKDDLLALAASRGVDVKASWSKQKIADALEAAPTNPEAHEGDTTQETQP